MQIETSSRSCFAACALGFIAAGAAHADPAAIQSQTLRAAIPEVPNLPPVPEPPTLLVWQSGFAAPAWARRRHA